MHMHAMYLYAYIHSIYPHICHRELASTFEKREVRWGDGAAGPFIDCNQSSHLILCSEDANEMHLSLIINICHSVNQHLHTNYMSLHIHSLSLYSDIDWERRERRSHLMCRGREQLLYIHTRAYTHSIS